MTGFVWSARYILYSDVRLTDVTPYRTPVLIVIRPDKSIDEERQIP